MNDLKLVKGLPSTHGDHYPLNTTTLIRHAARTYPEQEIIYRTSDGSWGRTTYADSYCRMQRSANALAELGVGPTDVVGVLDWNSHRFWELYWSIPGLAAVMLQMNLRLAPDDLGYVTTHSGASVVLVDESLLPVAEALVPHAPTVRNWIIMSDKPMSEIETTLPNALHYEHLLAEAPDHYDWPLIEENSTYSACYTSGTTGRPKGVYYSHRGIYLHAMIGAQLLGMNSADTTMLITPMFHGQCWGLPQMAALVASKLILPGRYQAADTAVLVDAMIAEDVTITNGAPAIFQPMLDYIRTLPKAPDFSRLRAFSGATEPPLSLMRGFHDLTGADIIHAYGATETTPLVAINRFKPTLKGVLSEDEQWNLRRCQGLLVSGVDFRLVDAHGTELPWDGDAQGEILMRGPWIIESYHNRPDTAENFDHGWWRSGDVGTIDTNGYLKITDRIKDVIKSGGEWISSIDMENALMGHPNIALAMVVGLPHPRWQERPVAFIKTRDSQDVPRAEIEALLEGRFAKWQFPDKVIRRDELPQTSVGKADKKVLREQFENLYEGDQA